MKVVSDGTTDWKHTLTCDRCGSKLEIEERDVKLGEFGANYGGETPEESAYVKCPVCPNRIPFRAPTWLMDRLRAKRPKGTK